MLTQRPYLPEENSGKTIGFVVHSRFDSRNIAVVKDLVHTVINNNMHSKYVIVHDNEERVLFWIDEFLKTYGVTEDRITRIPYPVKEHLDCKFYKSEINDRMLYEFKHLMAEEDIGAIYVFTNNHKATEIQALLIAGRQYNIRVICINSDGEYIDNLSERMYMNERMFIEGRFAPNEFNIDNTKVSRSVQRQVFAYRESK